MKKFKIYKKRNKEKIYMIDKGDSFIIWDPMDLASKAELRNLEAANKYVSKLTNNKKW